jgi:ABC-type multidrug transport system fused ATPase/permease subunit
MPAFSLLMKDAINAAASPAPGALVDALDRLALWMFGLAAATALLSYVEVAAAMWSAQRQAMGMRRRYFAALLRQDIGWLEAAGGGGTTGGVTVTAAGAGGAGSASPAPAGTAARHGHSHKQHQHTSSNLLQEAAHGSGEVMQGLE